MSITPVQSKTIGDFSPPATATFDANVTAGNLIIVTCGAYQLVVPTPTDNQGNTYISLGTEQSSPTTNTRSESFYTYATATGSLTVSFAGITGAISMSEWFGLAVSNPVDTTAAGAGAATTTPSAGATGTLTQADSLIYAALVPGTGVNASIDHDTADGFTLIGEIEDNIGAQAISTQYKIVSATTSVTPGWTVGTATEYTYTLAVFKGAPQTAPPAPTITNVSGGHERAGLQWIPENDGGLPSTDWDIDAATAAAPTTWLGVQATGSDSSFGAYTGLTNGTAYVFRVRGVNAIGDGSWSSTSGSATPVDDRGVFTLESDVDDFLLESGDRLLLESGLGSTVPEGSVTGAIGWTGSVTGVRTPKGDVTGAVTRTGSVTGVKTSKGDITGAITRTGVVVGGNLGVVVGGTITRTGSVTGVKTSKGAVTGAVTRTGSVTGVKLPVGSATGAITRTGSVTGAISRAGAVTGAITRTGSVIGVRTPKGAVTGAVTRTGSVTGVRTPKGAVTGAITRTGSVTGVRTPKGAVTGAITRTGVVVGGNLGVVVGGTITRTGSVTGTRTSKGSVSGSILWSGTISGQTPTVGINDGYVEGAITRTGSVTGNRRSQGLVTGAIGWSGNTAGRRLTRGAAAGVISWSGIVAGGESSGVVVGAIAWAGSVTGVRAPKGSILGAISWAGSVTGVVPNKGLILGATSWTGSVIGSIQKNGSVIGAIVWVGTVIAVVRFDPAIFLLQPHFVGPKPTVMQGASRGIAQGNKPSIAKGRDLREHHI